VSEEQQANPSVEDASAQPVADLTNLQSQLDALKAKNAELISERRKDKENRDKLQQQLSDIESAKKQAEEARLAESGEYKTLWDDAQTTISSLKASLAEKEAEVEQIKQGYSKEQLRSNMLSQLSSAGALAPDQLYRLVEDNLRSKDGQPVAVVGGVETPVAEYVANLKNPGSGYEHHFAASNTAGMGVTGSARATSLPGQSNPWLKDSFNITEQMILLAKDPDKARILKAEAGK
jgi:chromosome segregation ATPase